MEKMFELAKSLNSNEKNGELHSGSKFSCSKCNCEDLSVHNITLKTTGIRNFYAKGNSTQKTTPSSLFSILYEKSCNSKMRFTIYNPNPLPPVFLLRDLSAR